MQPCGPEWFSPVLAGRYRCARPFGKAPAFLSWLAYVGISRCQACLPHLSANQLSDPSFRSSTPEQLATSRSGINDCSQPLRRSLRLQSMLHAPCDASASTARQATLQRSRVLDLGHAPISIVLQVYTNYTCPVSLKSRGCT